VRGLFYTFLHVESIIKSVGSIPIKFISKNI